jgi:hypothetical protein
MTAVGRSPYSTDAGIDGPSSAPGQWGDKATQIGKRVASFVREYWPVILLAGICIGGYGLLAPGKLVQMVVAHFVGLALVGIAYACMKVYRHFVAPSSVPNLHHRVGKSFQVTKSDLTKEVLKIVADRVKESLGAINFEDSNTLLEVVNSLDPTMIQNSMELLSAGVCYGQTMVQMLNISENCTKSSKELHAIPEQNLEDVLFYQVLRNVKGFLTPGPKDSAVMALNAGLLDDRKKEVELKIVASERLSCHLCSLLAPAKYTRKPCAAGGLEAEFEKAMAGIDEAGVVSGWLRLSPRSDDYSHVIWFQCSNGHYRFQDTIDEEQGFFEFNDQKDLSSGLQRQLGIYPQYQNGTIDMTLFNI